MLERYIVGKTKFSEGKYVEGKSLKSKNNINFIWIFHEINVKIIFIPFCESKGEEPTAEEEEEEEEA